MPRDHSILTEHRNEDGEQVTEMTVEFDDGTAATFAGPPTGPFEFEGEGEPSADAIRALQDHLDVGEVAHDLHEGEDKERESETFNGSE